MRANACTAYHWSGLLQPADPMLFADSRYNPSLGRFCPAQRQGSHVHEKPQNEENSHIGGADGDKSPRKVITSELPKAPKYDKGDNR